MPPKVHSLFRTPDGSVEEIIPLLQGKAFTLEHIVSRGNASEAGFWYDQPKEEWVVLISGTATLEFKEAGMTPLAAGDCLLIPAHCQHRVAASSPEAHWLALHFDPRLPVT